MYVISICSAIELMVICSSKSIYEIQMTNSEAQHRALINKMVWMKNRELFWVRADLFGKQRLHRGQVSTIVVSLQAVFFLT